MPESVHPSPAAFRWVLVVSGAVSLGGLAQAQDSARLDCADQLGQDCGGELEVLWDEDTGTFAALELDGATMVLSGDSAEEAARVWLASDLAPMFDDGATSVSMTAETAGAALVYEGTIELGQGRVRVDFSQTQGGLNVMACGVSVELLQVAGGWTPVGVRGRYVPGLPAGMGSAALSTDVENGLAQRYPNLQVSGLSHQTQVEAVVAPLNLAGGGDGMALAYRVLTTDAQGVTWEILVDGQGGQELSRVKRTCDAVARGTAYAKHPGATPRQLVPLTGLYVFQGNDRLTTNDKGEHNFVGTVTLDEGLAGPLLRVFVDGAPPITYDGPADIALRPNELDAAQDELAAWHHIHNFNKHLAATYPRFQTSAAITTRFAMLVRARDQNGNPFANAFFTPQPASGGGDNFEFGYMAMGTFGAREAAKSGSVCQHEYCHALYSRIVDLVGTLQAGGLNEGLSDYFPAVFLNDPVLGGWLVQGGVRDLRQNFVWPRDNNDTVHRVGHIFAGALWDTREAALAISAARALEIDQAVAEGVFRMRDRPTLLDARTAILAGDRVVNEGRNRLLFANAFAAHGIGEAGQNEAPVLADLSGVRNVEVGETFTLVLGATDGDGDPVTFSVSPLDNSSLNPETNVFSFSPSAGQVGGQVVTVVASDGFLESTAVLEFEVTDPAPAPSNPNPIGAPGDTTDDSTATGAGPAPARSGGGGCALGAAGGAAGSAPAAVLLLIMLFGARRQQD